MGSENEKEAILRMTVEEGVLDESLRMGDIGSIAGVGLHLPDDISHEIDDYHHQDDYSTFSKKDFVELIKELSKESDFKKIDAVLKEIKPLFNDIRIKEKEVALNLFLSDGGAEENFEYANDELDNSYDATLRLIRDKRFSFYKKIENQKGDNLKLKIELLEKLRSLTDSEDTEHSFHKFKEIQIQWKQIGAVPNTDVKSLWANYSALVDRFYDNRSIYFELKELDRKRNLEAKLDLCQRAEQLTSLKSLNDAVRELNELHNEFRHIGPVPRDEKDAIWQRFKAASDVVYEKRDAHLISLQQELTKNLELKTKIIEEVTILANFQTDRIKEWNQKTQELLELQKKWENSGGVPRNKAKEINRKFWSAFKTFFAKKSVFFKKLDEERGKNLQLKMEIVGKAHELKDSQEWDKAANHLKDLQQHWREIGPVPEKYREKIFIDFKGACDHFFEQRRLQFEKHDHEQEENLSKKLLFCEELEKMILEKTGTSEALLDLQKRFNETGFVPKKSIIAIKERFNSAVEKLVESLGNISQDERERLLLELQLGSLKNDPEADRKIYQKEQTIRKRMTKVENDIAVWRNNLEFFGRSKNADKFKDEFNDKIKSSTEHLNQLKIQLKILKSV
ncbi:MAG: DUF349 domain-containing protein [Bacteroidota bacterium]